MYLKLSKTLQDGVQTDCILIDYQMVRESSPAFDIMYMMFNSTTHEQRQKHYYEFLDYYHKYVFSILSDCPKEGLNVQL